MGRPKRKIPKSPVPVSEQGYKKCIMQLRHAALYQNLELKDLFKKSDEWLLDQPYIGIKCLYVLRQIQQGEVK
jgi:hypothetical protein